MTKSSMKMTRPYLNDLVCVALVLLGGGSQHLSAQTLSKPSRTVYKCLVDGKATYSDEPCLGAQIVNVEPMRGLNKSTGKELTGNDVVEEKKREAMADRLRPLTGLNVQQYETDRRRFTLSPEAKLECARLDVDVAQHESKERQSSAEFKPALQRDLFSLRKRHRQLSC